MSKKEDKHEKMKRLGKEAMTGPRVVGKMVKEAYKHATKKDEKKGKK